MRVLASLFVLFGMAVGAHAQTPPPASQGESAPLALPAIVCDLQVPAPSTLPPAGSGPLVYALMPCFAAQGGAAVIDPATYLHYIELKNYVSIPDENRWVPYTDQIEQLLVGDFKRLWATNFLDDLAVDVRDVQLGNGVIGKLVVYNMEERQRIKIVDYVGSDKVDQSKIEEKLKELGINLRIDSFIDPGLIRRVAGVVRQTYAEEGYQFTEVKPAVKELPGGPKLVHLTFNIDAGPKVRIREVDFVGNSAVSDRRLERQMKENNSGGFFSFITGGGTYQEDKFEEDADAIIEYYRKRGYITARVGQPDLKILEDENDGSTRWVELRVPVTEGKRYRVGNFTFDGNTIVKGEALRSLFKVDEGRLLQRRADPEGARQGARGLRRRRLLRVHRLSRSLAARPAGRRGRRRASGAVRRQRRPARRRRDDARAGGEAVLREPDHVHGQHHHARQRHPARAAARRERRVQHRGARSTRSAGSTSSGTSRRSRVTRSRSRRRRGSTTRSTSSCRSRSRTGTS